MYDGITDIYVVIVPTTMSSLLSDSYSYNGKKNDTTWPLHNHSAYAEWSILCLFMTL